MREYPRNECMTAEMVRHFFTYDPETGVFINRISRGRSTQVGAEAGCVNSAGHIFISFRWKKFMAHRMAWLYMTGRWPKNDIDHIDGNRSNNRFSNLRDATPSQNIANSGIRRNNTSGYKGVSLYKGGPRWRAVISVGGRRIELGCGFKTKQAAHAAYVDAAKQHFGEFFNAG